MRFGVVMQAIDETAANCSGDGDPVSQTRLLIYSDSDSPDGILADLSDVIA